MGKAGPENPRHPRIDPETLALIQRSLGRHPLGEIELELEDTPSEEPYPEETDTDDKAS